MIPDIPMVSENNSINEVMCFLYLEELFYNRNGIILSYSRYLILS